MNEKIDEETKYKIKSIFEYMCIFVSIGFVLGSAIQFYDTSQRIQSASVSTLPYIELENEYYKIQKVNITDVELSMVDNSRLIGYKTIDYNGSVP